jgi:hypothetical protein
MFKHLNEEGDVFKELRHRNRECWLHIFHPTGLELFALLPFQIPKIHEKNRSAHV